MTVESFCTLVRGALGPASVTFVKKKARLHIRLGKEYFERLSSAKRSVELCSSRGSRLADACEGARNIAAILDLVAIPHPGVTV
jgi:hypothetical protein